MVRLSSETRVLTTDKSVVGSVAGGLYFLVKSLFRRFVTCDVLLKTHQCRFTTETSIFYSEIVLIDATAILRQTSLHFDYICRYGMHRGTVSALLKFSAFVLSLPKFVLLNTPLYINTPLKVQSLLSLRSLHPF